MTTTTEGTSRTAHLLALMKKGDDAFNARDFAAVDEVHHPDMVAYITGLAEPVYGKEAHAAAMQQMLRIFPDMHVYSDPYPIQFGSGDWITVVTNCHRDLHRGDDPARRHRDPPDRKGVRRRVRPDHQVGRRPAHRHLRLLTTPPCSGGRSASPSGEAAPAGSRRPDPASRPGRFQPGTWRSGPLSAVSPIPANVSERAGDRHAARRSS